MGVVLVESEGSDQFSEFFGDVEPRLRRAFVAAYGPDRGTEATAEALAYAWEHWPRVQAMRNPAGYLYRVGQSRTRPRLRPPIERPHATQTDTLVEPSLSRALSSLSRRQRLSVVLIEGFDWTLSEVSELTGVSTSTVKRHLDRGLAKLRRQLEVHEDA